MLPKWVSIDVQSATMLPSRSAAAAWLVPCTPPLEPGPAGRGDSPFWNGHGSRASIGRAAARSSERPAARRPANASLTSPEIGTRSRSGSP